VTAPHRPCGRRLVDPEWNALERLQVRACRVSRQATVVDQKHSRSLWLVGNCLARLTSPRLPSDLWRACWSIENSGEPPRRVRWRVCACGQGILRIPASAISPLAAG